MKEPTGINYFRVDPMDIQSTILYSFLFFTKHIYSQTQLLGGMQGVLLRAYKDQTQLC